MIKLQELAEFRLFILYDSIWIACGSRWQNNKVTNYIYCKELLAFKKIQKRGL